MPVISPRVRHLTPRWMFLVALVLGLGACVTPSIPIPPPNPARMTFTVSIVDTTSGAVFSYPPDSNYHNGVAYIYNRDKGVGVIQNVNPDDSIGPSPRFAAALGDQIVVSVQTVDQTESTCIRLRDGTGQDANSCSP
ncbi:MAG: hypothetical protein JWL83_3120 [Actinomycetia bacterium]|nr:hypothetical protein [Actinomycetes bacterium]